MFIILEKLERSLRGEQSNRPILNDVNLLKSKMPDGKKKVFEQ